MEADQAKNNPHVGSSFEDFLRNEGTRNAAHAHTIKRVLPWQIAKAMEAQGSTKSERAKRINTRRAMLDRLLNPDNDKVQLDTPQRAALALGRTLRLELA